MRSDRMMTSRDLGATEFGMSDLGPHRGQSKLCDLTISVLRQRVSINYEDSENVG
jgi:hypothetical protein